MGGHTEPETVGAELWARPGVCAIEAERCGGSKLTGLPLFLSWGKVVEHVAWSPANTCASVKSGNQDSQPPCRCEVGRKELSPRHGTQPITGSVSSEGLMGARATVAMVLPVSLAALAMP